MNIFDYEMCAERATVVRQQFLEQEHTVGNRAARKLTEDEFMQLAYVFYGMGIAHEAIKRDMRLKQFTFTFALPNDTDLHTIFILAQTKDAAWAKFKAKQPNAERIQIEEV